MSENKPTNMREWGEQGPDPEGRGDGRHLFPDVDRNLKSGNIKSETWRPKGWKGDLGPGELGQVRLVDIIELESRLFRFTFKIRPSAEVCEMVFPFYDEGAARRKFWAENYRHRKRVELINVESTPYHPVKYYMYDVDYHDKPKVRVKT